MEKRAKTRLCLRTLKFPLTLAGKFILRFNWKISGNFFLVDKDGIGL